MTTPPAAAAQGRDRTVLWGWLGIIVGLLCCGVLGVIFGVLSLREAERHRNTRTLGWIAIIASLVNIAAGGIFAATGNYPWQTG